jgi:hypothetical protein
MRSLILDLLTLILAYSSLSLYSITKPINALIINYAYLFRIVSERIVVERYSPPIAHQFVMLYMDYIISY